MRFFNTSFFKLGLSVFLTSLASAAVAAPFTLSISGPDIGVEKKLELADVGKGTNKINFDFKDNKGAKYNFDLKYRALPSNRSYPSNLDITIKDGKGNKRGYLFFAINNVAFLEKMGVFGMIVDIDGKPFDIKFTFDSAKSGSFSVAGLEGERLVSDTLFPKKGFQMIRPMVLPKVAKGHLSQSYSLDAHPYEMNYTLKNMPKGLVQFQYNLSRKLGEKRHLLERIYFNADSLATLRQGMFAGKYFDPKDGAFKLVFYPAMGQTAPPVNER